MSDKRDKPPPTQVKAWQVLESRKWAPIAFARNDKGFGIKPELLAAAEVLSAYAALCIAYPDTAIRGHLINQIKSHIDWQMLSEWESKPGRTVDEVIALLKKVEG